MMNAILCSCLLFISTLSFSQDTVHSKKLQYFGLHQVGLLTGSSTEKFGVLTTNGVRFGNWYAGISTGIDWYGIRSIPLLASIHKAFDRSRHQPFVYGNVGIGFVWQSDKSFINVPISATNHFEKGFTGEFGIGYFINLKNNTALSLSAGYSYKEIGVEQKGYNIGVDPIFISTYNYKYYYRRIAIRLGIKI